MERKEESSSGGSETESKNAESERNLQENSSVAFHIIERHEISSKSAQRI
jgi:hypothetical protein